MIIKRIIHNIKRIIYLTILPFKVGRYLKNGTYRYNESTSSLFKANNESERSRAYRSGLFAEQSSSDNLFRVVFSKLYKIRVLGKDKFFSGDMMIISSSGQECKFFDFEKGMLLSLFFNRIRYSTVLKNRIDWSHYLTVPNYSYNSDAMTITEELLIPEELPVSSVFNLICNNCSLLSYSSERGNIDCLSREQIGLFFSMINRPEMTASVYDFIKGANYKECLTHGDLWRSNLIWSKSTLYYLDYEMVGKRVYFYDILFFLFSESFFMNNKKALKRFIEGEFDGVIAPIFRNAGCDYDYLQRRVYMYSFLCIFYYERWFLLGNRLHISLMSLLDELHL